MKALDATNPTINASGTSIVGVSTPNRGVSQVAATLRHRHESAAGRPLGSLGDASERDDRQMLPSASTLDAQFDDRTRSSSHERV